MQAGAAMRIDAAADDSVPFGAASIAATAIKTLARECGAQAVRIASAASDAPTRGSIRDALARGDLATWSYDDAYANAASDPATLLPGARSVVCIAVAYATPGPRERRGRGRVSAYAWSRDYHRRMQAMLRAIAARIDELAGESGDACRVRYRSACRARVRRAGRARVDRQAHEPHRARARLRRLPGRDRHHARRSSPTRRCARRAARARACVDVCPTGALRGDRTMDATRCISDLTQRRDAIPRALRPLVGTLGVGLRPVQRRLPAQPQRRPCRRPGLRPARTRTPRSPTCRRCCACAAPRSLACARRRWAGAGRPSCAATPPSRWATASTVRTSRRSPKRSAATRARSCADTRPGRSGGSARRERTPRCARRRPSEADSGVLAEIGAALEPTAPMTAFNDRRL